MVHRNNCGNGQLFILKSVLTIVPFKVAYALFMQRLTLHIASTLLALALIVSSSSVHCQSTPLSGAHPFTENEGQWHEQVMFRADLPDGYLFLERTSFTYSFYDGKPLKFIHAVMPPEEGLPEYIDAHAFKVHFDNCNPNPSTEKILESESYQNYFLGNNESKWASKVRSYSKVSYGGLYNGIDMAIYDQDNVLKYDFIVEAGADPDQIAMTYEGTSSLKLRRGNLLIETTVNSMQEQRPVAFQMKHGQRTSIPCKFKLKGKTVTFEFPDGYDTSKELIIDPVLVFGSYSGSPANNFGFTATYDAGSNLYGGGIVFSGASPYPTSTGAYQVSMTGGTIDIGVSKFSPDGTSLIYSTYIGGTGNEAPHTMVVGGGNQLIIMGTTGSVDYPTTSNAFDNSFAGGNAVAPIGGYGYGHLDGTDIIVTRFLADGTGLVGSTYVGGTDNDGITYVDSLDYNYGDTWRGEVIVDASDNIIVATTTASTDFPVANAAQGTFGGGARDGVVFRLSNQLNAMMFGTYIGGSKDDAAYGVQIDSNGGIYVCGGTKSSDFPVTAGVINPTYSGNVDGYVVRYSPGGNGIIAATFIGTPSHDQTYFVQLDQADDVFVVGQSDGGTYPVSSNVYNNAGSGQFIHKMNNLLTVTEWSTVFGTSNGTVDISISAFLVSKCDEIYVSGWGGLTNRVAVGGFMSPFNSTTSGMPVSNDAYQATTDGSDFYLIVLSQDAAALVYATFFGGTQSNEHVDGGTSRFDKKGKVYQAVCAGCGGNNDFPTTNNAYSNTNGSSCNLGVFKFDLGPIMANLAGNPGFVCLPDSIQFTNSSFGATDYYWIFGDGEFSTDFEPWHEYDSAGVYNVMLIAYDPSRPCVDPDTTFFSIIAIPPVISFEYPDSICLGDTVQLSASGAVTYHWSPSTYLSDSTIANPLAFPPSTILYTITSGNQCYTVIDSITVIVQDHQIETERDTFICFGESIGLSAQSNEPGTTYLWSPTGTLNNPNLAAPTATPSSSIHYIAQGTSPLGCIAYDTVYIIVDFVLPIPQLSPDTIDCAGTGIVLYAEGARHYLWTPVGHFTDPTDSTQTVVAQVATTYTVYFTNGCGTVEADVTVGVVEFYPAIGPDQWLCPNDTAVLWAGGGVDYIWYDNYNIGNANTAEPQVWPMIDYTYFVIIVDSSGCTDTLSTDIFMYDMPDVVAGPDQTIDWGAAAMLFSAGDGILNWITNDSMSCTACETPTVWPTSTTAYVVQITDTNGCKNTDTTLVYVSGSLYVPNTFSPNGDGRNDIFYAYGAEIKEYEMWIFNRWGQLIFTSGQINYGWDGTYRGADSQIDTYVWKVRFKETSGREGEILYGHVNLVR
jgi:gliding motility-associated-like protein